MNQMYAVCEMVGFKKVLFATLIECATVSIFLINPYRFLAEKSFSLIIAEGALTRYVCFDYLYKLN